ncbi:MULTISPECIES: phenylalanine--tRNA ligase subunit alpha [unclassified Lentimonas]|uniref:phenylalanine--tRNA ligase subunit alpha n=1 Tax=unclassified Lentimonas TaxID=2630993 RepID=UPI00132CAE7E|nr:MULTISPECIES: phenylalanine--tRNA ligase subunit alpha [unclassified Lentimonas]CAA6678522.1 Phenylalanyl-tRNA synthetase alpha chain (EC [Lentimonas sp. CC4]CAA6685754.1 Phenylalanyl-tRNA synthetase alpha chain (EC [Lentimonas sp. CC6]CAA6695107.1 Phenylalanyl-tRNA synthetase alpha chain (EC [Lentimonas sp. CC19]CAA6697221.1 Phenylalanyl-tRNA synthetase alpha chain (EC [Lentimonas sp. CC10]CAA7070469.1 Phenylalanyl-tRNA synthetase alpha chain (EC [Lentimonas sp. CC11]
MQEELTAIVATVRENAPNIQTRAEFEAYKATVSGPKGSLTDVMKSMGKVPKEDKPAMGKLINEAKTAVTAAFDEVIERLEAAELAAKLGPAIDPTLPCPDLDRGTLHPISQVREEMVELFRRIGFSVAEATEVDTEHYCFDALNIPSNHPARDMQDSYYLPDDLKVNNVSKHADEKYLLRTHTSTVQIRTMLKEKPPIRIVAPGRCFRRDTPDATHSANFHQIEGLYVDKNVTLLDLKATLDHFVKTIFGPKAKTRLRPSFFPFTEPSYEMDFFSPDLGKLSNKWLEIMGCGMVDPEVFKAVGIDPEVYTGFAFGMGIERIAMILQGVDDIRYYYQNDVRFLKQFA